MNLTREQTIEALEICRTTTCDECPLCNVESCSEILDDNALKFLKENEPAPSANDTSSKENNSHSDSNTISEICQEAMDKIMHVTDDK